MRLDVADEVDGKEVGGLTFEGAGSAAKLMHGPNIEATCNDPSLYYT